MLKQRNNTKKTMTVKLCMATLKKLKSLYETIS